MRHHEPLGRKSQGVSEKLGTLIEGESLFNDGSAIVVFEVFLGELAVSAFALIFLLPATGVV